MTGSLDRIRVSALIFLLGGYLILSYPFMQLRIPPTGLGVPIGELFLAAFLLSINIPAVLARMGTVVILPLLIFWWGWGLTRLTIDSIREGPWAFRDGTQLIETLYIIVGFAVAASQREMPSILLWVRRILIVSCLYGLLYIYQLPIIMMSPTLPGGSDQPIPIFGAFSTTGTLLLLGAFFCLIQPTTNPLARLRFGAIAGFLVAYAILVIQMRTTYVQLLTLSALLFVVRPSALRLLGVSIPILVVLLLVITAFEIRISGRLSSEISFSFLWDHVQAIVGISSDEQSGVAHAAGGVSLRLGWWLRLYGELTSDLATLITGLGYGVPLTDFRDTLNVVAREPHNSVISVTARLGLVGGLCWIWIQVELFRAGFRAYRDCRRLARHEEGRFVLLVVAFAALTLASCLGEDTMEKPYNAIPYYALWGVVLRIAYNVRKVPAKGYNPRGAAIPAGSVP